MLRSTTSLVWGVALAASTSLAHSQSVLAVDISGSGDFTSVQDAVLSAQDGDHILVSTGTYGPVSIVGKGLSITEDRGAQVTIQGGVRIESTLDTHEIFLSGLTLRGRYVLPQDSEHAIECDLVRGPLRVQDCELIAAAGLGYTRVNDHGGDGAHLVNVLDGTFVRCTILGGDGGANFDGSAYLQRSGHGLWGSGGRLVLQECELVAGDSMEFDITTCDYGGQQGHGAYLMDCDFYASGSSMRGGLGGTEGLCAQIFPGGDGLRAAGTTTAVVLDCLLQGGPNNVCNAGAGPPSSTQGPATIAFLGGDARLLEIPTPSRSGDVEALTVQGQPGDFAWLLLSFTAGYRELTPVYSAPLLVGTPLASPRRDLGFVPSGGTLQVPIVAPAVGQGSLVLDLHTQLLIRDAAGAITLSHSKRWTTFDPSL